MNNTTKDNNNEQKALQALSGTTADCPKPTLHVAAAVFGKGTPKRKVNPMLYKLQRDGYVQKVSEENGSKPQWYLTTKGRESQQH
jgi:hypothetical protein